MGKALQRRNLRLSARSTHKVKARKYNPPVRGRRLQLQEANRPVLVSVLSKLRSQEQA